MDELRFFNPYADIRFTANRLPHWQQEGAFILLRFGLPMPFLIGCVLNGNPSVKLGCAFIRNRGAPKSSANIMSRSRERWSAGSMPVMVPASCGAPIAQPSWRKRYAILMVNVLCRSRLGGHAQSCPHLFVQNAAWPLEKILLSWKGFTARRISALLGRIGNFGNEIISIGSSVMKSISRVAFATYGGTQLKQVCAMANSMFIRASLRESSSKPGTCGALERRRSLFIVRQCSSKPANSFSD
jgi:hypothetical protein